MKKKIILLLTLLAFTPSAFAFQSNSTAEDDQVAQEMIDDHRAALDQSLSRDARIQKLKAFLTKYQETTAYHGKIYVQLAADLFIIKQYTEAVKYGKEAESKDVIKNVDVLNQITFYQVMFGCYVTLKNNQQALAYLNKLIQAAAPHINDERIKKIFDAAETEKKRRTAPPPKPKPSPINEAIKLYNQKKYSDAEKAFAKLDKKDPKAAYNYARTLYQLKKYSKAMNKFITAGVLAPAEYPQARPTAQSIFLRYLYRDRETKLRFNDLVEEMNEWNRDLQQLNNIFNQKFAGKTEEELTEAEKSELAELNKKIEKANENIKYFLDKQQDALDAFNALVEKAKKSLGVD